MSDFRLACVVVSCCVVGCLKQPDPASHAVNEPASNEPEWRELEPREADPESSDGLAVAPVCDHMWKLRDGEDPRERSSITAASSAETMCVPQLLEHRRLIGDDAFERESACVLMATDAEALEGCSIGPDQEPRQLCGRALDFMTQLMPTVSEEAQAEALAACVRGASIDRLTADPEKWRIQVDCMRAAPTMDEMGRCDPDYGRDVDQYEQH